MIFFLTQISEDGSIDKEAALKYIEKLELEAWQLPILQAAVDKCAPTANSKSVINKYKC